MKQARFLLILLTAINLANYMDRYVLAAVLDPLGRDLGLSNEQLGFAASMFLITYMAAAPIFGFMAEKFNRPRLVTAGVMLWSLATAGAAFATGYKSLLLARALVGVGEAAYATLGPVLLADSFAEDERAAKFTWFYLAIPVGSALGYMLGGIVAGHWGWRAAFLVAGAPGIILAIVMAFQSDPIRGGHDTHADEAKGEPFIGRMRLLFTNRIWIACTVSYIAYTFAMGALSTWAPALLGRRFGVGLKEVGLVFGGLVVVTGILGTFAGGGLTTRLQRRWPDAGVWLSAITLIVAAPIAAWSLRSGHLYLTYGLFFAALFLLFVNTSPVNALAVSCLPASVRATGTAVNVLLIHLLGDAFSPALVGHRADVLIKSGLSSGAALAGGMSVVIPAILISALALWWARGWTPGHSSEA